MAGKSTQTGLRIPKAQTGAAMEHEAGQLAAESTAQFNILVKATATQHQCPGVLLGQLADGDGILDSVLTVAIYGYDHRFRGEIILNIIKSGFDSLPLACVLRVMQYCGAGVAVVKNIAAAVIAAVVYNNNGETGIAQITDQTI